MKFTPYSTFAEDSLLNILRGNLDKGDTIGKKLVFDRNSKTLREASLFDDPDQTLRVTPEDMDVFTYAPTGGKNDCDIRRIS